MHVSRLTATQFKCFAELTIDLDGTPQLVVLCGENGTGKSSVLDAVASWRLRQTFGIGDPTFFARGGALITGQTPGTVTLAFHEPPPADSRTAVYVRTAQRVTVEFSGTGVQALQPPRELAGPARSIDLDDRVGENYQRLIAASIDALWDSTQRGRPIGEVVDELVGRVAGPLGRLLPGLSFDGPDRPLEQGSTFRFSKGSNERYPYKNLSGGEKAVFDLLLDAAMKSVEFNRAIWCLDEPELHVNPRIHGHLLREILDLLDPEAQLWISSHSPGMLAEARRRYADDPSSVCFLDLAASDPDQTVNLTPVTPDRTFWRQQLSVALGDLASLVAPAKVVLCEGSPDSRDRPRARWDARVLEQVFAAEYPDASFVSVGNSDDVVGDRMDVGSAIEALVSGTEVLRVIDRDGRSPQEVADLETAGCRVLRRRHLEAYLLDDEVLDALCEQCGQVDKQNDVRGARDDALAASIGRNNAADDYKRASGQFVNAARLLLGITAGGNLTETFLRDTLAPCLRSDMQVYAELRADIFGS